MGGDPVVHLIDGHVYIFRAYYSLPEMFSPDGMPTQAAYGFANTLIRLLADARVTHAAVCFDESMQSFRNEIEPSYKANRGETPEDLEPQFELCTRVARALGLAVFEEEGFEADDLIASLAAQIVRGEGRVVVVSSDKDLAQLVREDGRIVLHDLARDTTLDADAVRAKFGVDPTQIPDYLGLAGDTIDNLKGVPGVGPKSAAAVLTAFGRIEGVPVDPAEWAGVGVRGTRRLAALVSEHRERALKTRALATLREDALISPVAVEDLAWSGARSEEFELLCEQLGWKGIVRRMEDLLG